MKIQKMKFKFLTLLTIVFFISINSADLSNRESTDFELLVHKTPTCGCCKMWVKHIEENGFIAQIRDHTNLNSIKETYDIKPEYRSCHTSVSSNGYIFEGHIPAKFIEQFLSEEHLHRCL